jgi:integrase/recombinase XerD
MVRSSEVRGVAGDGDEGGGFVGHRLVDEFLRFAAGRARPNTVRAYAHDLKTFFAVVGKDPVDVRAKDVLGFITAQQRARAGAENVARISDGGSGLAVATIRRRLAAVSAFYGYLIACGDAGVETNPVPRGLPTRRRRDGRGQPLVRAVRRLPRILDPEEVAALIAALRTARDRAIVQAMVLGGLRRCEVLGLRLEDLRLGEWRVFIAEGKGGHQRLVPVSTSFFATVAAYMDVERPAGAATDRLFVVLKGSNRGRPLSADGLDEIISAARARAGLAHGTCHELRHTCLTRLREHGMSLEVLQAQAGHRSIASTQMYLHLGADWLAGEYRRAAEAIEAQALVGMPR